VSYAEIAQELDLLFVVLFGSQARNGKGRDTDLALMPRNPFRISEGWEPARALVGREQRGDLDVVWLPSGSWLLAAEVARDGKVLYEAEPGAFLDFQAAAERRSLDSNVWRRRQSEFVQDFLGGGCVLNRDLIQDNLALLVQSLREMEPVLAAGEAAFVAEPMRHHAAERLTELLVECAAKINSEVGKQAGIAPTDYYSSFFALVSAGWLDNDTARSLAEIAALRNVIIHQYQRINLKDLYCTIGESLSAWRRYAEQVASRLESQKGPG